jgi:hypothetical protein
VAQGVGPEFKPQYCKNNKNERKKKEGWFVLFTFVNLGHCFVTFRA